MARLMVIGLDVPSSRSREMIILKFKFSRSTGRCSDPRKIFEFPKLFWEPLHGFGISCTISSSPERFWMPNYDLESLRRFRDLVRSPRVSRSVLGGLQFELIGF